MAKYRPNKIKIQHHVLSEIKRQLEQIANYPEVDGIIPGMIKPKKGGSVGITLSYYTDSGLKLIARSGGAAQEVFVISKYPDLIEQRLITDGMIAVKKT